MDRRWSALRILILVLGAVTSIVAAAHSASAGQRPSEALLDRQQRLLERTLAELQPSSPERPHLYFVGFAGFGGAAVFKREVLAARQLFDERFGTRSRSIALINHPSTAHEIPLATATNLDRTLQHIGTLIDKGKDTLFLFLTSHGETDTVVVQMPGVALRQLTPTSLKDALDNAGIIRRVIVVSACHAGSFIPALANATSLVIAAARADRSSFGCEDRRRWTYFGDAYFNHSLRSETSFRRAFARARRLISLWETRDALLPSLPQIAGGESLTGVD